MSVHIHYSFRQNKMRIQRSHTSQWRLIFQRENRQEERSQGTCSEMMFQNQGREPRRLLYRKTKASLLYGSRLQGISPLKESLLDGATRPKRQGIQLLQRINPPEKGSRIHLFLLFMFLLIYCYIRISKQLLFSSSFIESSRNFDNSVDYSSIFFPGMSPINISSFWC